MDTKKLTELYMAANKLDPKRHYPLTTERIFAAMDAARSEGYRAAMSDVTARLAAAIQNAESVLAYARENRGVHRQDEAAHKLDSMRAAFAFATGTAVGGMHFEAMLAEARPKVDASAVPDSMPHVS